MADDEQVFDITPNIRIVLKPHGRFIDFFGKELEWIDRKMSRRGLHASRISRGEGPTFEHGCRFILSSSITCF